MMNESTKQTQYFLSLIILLSLLHHSLQNSTLSFPNEALPTKSGYLKINPKSDSAIFYTFYEAKSPTSSLSQTPLLIWLQGGPGCSSMIGNFFELGPYRVNNNLVLEPNLGSWNRIFGVIFIDNPIGTGFSVAASSEEIPRNQRDVAKHLYAAISGFLELNPGFKTRPLYITGESYAGKYVPAIGYYILKQNMKLDVSKQVNLKGVAIGNGLTDPIVQVKTHALSAYYSGLVNEKQKAELEEAQLKAVEFVKMRNWSEATHARSKVLNLLQNMTGLATLYDFSKREAYQTSLVTEFLKSEEVKKALGAKESIVFEECSDAVGEALHEDVMKSVKYMVEFLVRNTEVLLYQGHYDLRDGVVSTEAWVKTMKWEGIGKFMMAERKVWKVNGVLGGYLQKWGSLSHAIVMGAGHLVPTDQSFSSQVMIEDWVLQKRSFGYQDTEIIVNQDHSNNDFNFD